MNQVMEKNSIYDLHKKRIIFNIMQKPMMR